MAFQGFTPQTDDYIKSEFNAASYKMRRLDKLFDLLNQINVNLTAWNQEYGVWNYELKFSLCEQLYQEVESKLTTEERLDGESLIVAIRNAIDKFSIYKTNKDLYGKKIQRVNEIHYRVIKNWLFKLETAVRKFIDSHGMDTKYEDEAGL